MASIDFSILDSAFKAGCFKNDEQLHYHPSVNTAIAILQEIKESEGNGLDSEQIAHLIGIHRNTAVTFLTWLKSKNLITSSENFNDGKGKGKSKRVTYYVRF